MADALTIYFDSSCPLCQREIVTLRRLDQKGRRFVFEDVSPADAEPSCLIPRDVLMARYHVKLADGSIVDGARAFTESWGQIWWLAWLKPIGRFMPTRWLLNRLYAVFLKFRPALQKWAHSDQ